MLLHTMMRGGKRVIDPITLLADTSNYNLFTAAGSPTDVVDVTITINAGVTVSSASTASYAFDTGIFPAGSSLTLINNGIILGRGGNGGLGYNAPGTNPLTGAPTPGAAGGPAFRAQSAISITNNNRIAGGGGGGNGGVGGEFGSGGGGGGIGVSAGGLGVGDNGVGGTLTAAGRGGNPGGYTPPSIAWDPDGNAIADGGGYGGSYGLPGGRAYGDTAPTTGGAAGAAVVGNSNITWAVTGTRNGAIT